MRIYVIYAFTRFVKKRKNMDKRKTLGVVTASALTAVGLMVSTLAFTNDFKASTRLKASDYSLTLSSSNGISESGSSTKSIKTDSGNYEVEFGYTNCAPLNGGHAVINAGGNIVNNDHIRSIYSLVANFSTSGELKFRTSYDGATWGGYTTMKAQEEYDLASNPYYVEFSTDGTHSVNLTSVQFNYTCEENPNAIGTTVNTEDEWVRVNSASDLSSGDEIVLAAVYSGSWYTMQNETISGRSYWLQTASITLTDSNSKATVTDSHSVWTVTTGNTSNTWKFQSNGKYLGSEVSGTYYNLALDTSYSSSRDDWSLTFNNSSVSVVANGVNLYLKKYTQNNQNAFEYAGQNKADSYTKYIFKKVAGQSGTTYETPVDENGFTAVDTNKDSYNTNSIFDSANGLTVKATFTDGTTQTLSKGENGYTYVIKNSSGTPINTAQAFGTEDVYTLVVSYKKYIPVEITLNVGVYTYLTGVTPSLTVTQYNTADILSTNLATTLTAALTYNVSSLNKTVGYNNFSANNLAVTLIDPNGVAKNITSAFGEAGVWTLKVYSTEDSSIYGTVSLTVSAIAVTDITLSNTALTIYVGNTAQLTATVNPTNATNQGIIWTSSDSTVASVSETGLVTAKKVGTATITATSSDGGKTATCAITVKKQSGTQATITSNSNGTNNQAASISASSFQTEGITLSSASASGSVYYSGDSSYRLGKGSGTGSITFTIPATVITSITLDAAAYNMDTDVPVKISTSANTTGETVTVADSTQTQIATTAFASDTTESTTITVETTSNGKRIFFYGLTVMCGVAEPVYPTAISLSNASCNVGYTTQLEPVFTPFDTNQKTLVWESSNTSVATVSSTGLVTGVSAGTTTITATGYDENDQPVVGTCTVTVTTVAVTGVSLNKTSSDLSLNSTLTLEATVAPANATNKNVTWTSSNTSVATVSNGTVTAKAVGTTTITVKTVDGNKTATCTINVISGPSDDYTIMIYMCGADLESSNGLATGDLTEIFNVTGQPDGVNIIVETGGASSWKKYNISANYLTRYHVENQGLVKDSQETKASMGLQSTFQSFLEWGMTEYPAKKTGVIMWNHGGALDGCCFDENFSDDPITNSEAKAAYAAAFNNVGRTENLEWIGYDACLMAVQDVAEFNSHYFNYMVASQETEGGYGWDYDRGWLKSLFNNPTGIETSTLLTQICTNFIADNSSESTLSVLDLTKMSAYKTAWENVALQLTNIINSSSKWTSFKNVVNQCKKFGYSSDYSQYNNGYAYDVFDAQDLITKCQSNSTYSSCSWSALQTAFTNLVICSKYTSDYSGSHGLNFFCPLCPNINTSSYYSTSITAFTTWRTLCYKY